MGSSAPRQTRAQSAGRSPLTRRSLASRLGVAVSVGFLSEYALGAQGSSHATDPPQPQAPAAASDRTKELVARMRFDVPPPVQVAHSVSYRLSTRADADDRRLDVYRNMSSGKDPVVIFFHGGAWKTGHRRQYLPLGVSLALKRVTTVIPSYSKAPKYPFPEPVRDAAAVVAWVYDVIATMGGNPDKIFLAGHSSGVQIAALVALDPRYLLFHNLPTTVIRGVIGISGIYEVPPGFEYAFGSAQQTRAQASPSRFIQAPAPPFLVVHGGNDSELVLRQSPLFLERLKERGIEVEEEVYPEEDHSSIIALASVRGSALLNRIDKFVERHS